MLKSAKMALLKCRVLAIQCAKSSMENKQCKAQSNAIFMPLAKGRARRRCFSYLDFYHRDTETEHMEGYHLERVHTVRENKTRHNVKDGGGNQWKMTSKIGSSSEHW